MTTYTSCLVASKNNLKLSYSTTANLDQIISSHNKKVLTKSTSEAPIKKCNCAGGVQTCPVEGECFLTDSIYEATVTAENIDTKKYVGSAATTFKKIHSNHKSDFKISSRRTATKLSGYIWQLKDKNVQPTIKFQIKEHAKSYHPAAGRCLLCLTEKLRIMQVPPDVYLNHRTELLAKCRHRNKYLLSNCI